MASNGRAAEPLHEKGNAPEVVVRGASTQGFVQRDQDSRFVANSGVSVDINPSTDDTIHTQKRQAAHAKEARIEGERLLRWMEKSPELRAAIALAARKDRARQRAHSAEVFMAILRLSEVRRVLRDRYGGEDFVLPEDDAGLDDTVILANCLASLSRGRAERIATQLLHHAPWMSEGRAMQVACRAISSPTSYKADTLARKLGVTDDLRTRLDLRTIGATDVDAEARAKRRRVKDAEAARRRRAANGAMTREDYLADAEFKRDLCTALGIHRNTLANREKKGTLPPLEEQVRLVVQVRRQYISVGDTNRSDGLAQSDAVEQDSSTEAGRGLDAAPDQASVQVVQPAPRNRASGFVPRRSAAQPIPRLPSLPHPPQGGCVPQHPVNLHSGGDYAP